MSLYTAMKPETCYYYYTLNHKKRDI